MSAPSPQRLGRKPAFTRFEAFQMLENRKLFRGDRCTVDQFIEQMLAAGEIKSEVSRATMHRLLSGSMYPDLRVFLPDGTETDEPYKYEDVPKCAPGQAPKPERLFPDGAQRPRLTIGQKKLIAEIKLQTEAYVATQTEMMVQGYLAGVNRRLAQLEENEARRAGFLKP